MQAVRRVSKRMMRMSWYAGPAGGAMHRFSAVLLVGIAAAGCVPDQRKLFDPMTKLPEAPAAFELRDWETVLRENVRNERVDYEHLSAHAAPLDSFLTQLAAIGPQSAPESFPTDASRSAYYINAYNAVVLKAVLSVGIPQTIHDPHRPPLDYAYLARVDRREQTLADLRAAALHAFNDDPRIHLGLSNAAVGSPPLQSWPFYGARLEEQLKEVAAAAMSNPRMVTIDHTNERLNVAIVIDENRDGFVAWYNLRTGTSTGTLLSALLLMAEGPRRDWLNTAVGYGLGKIPFDRALNRWPPDQEGAAGG